MGHARAEADRLGHNFLGTEHLLLGILKVGQGVAVDALARLGADAATLRSEVEKQAGPVVGPAQEGDIPYTPRFKKVLAYACQAAKELDHTYLGSEHLLLGLVRENDGMVARLFRSLGLTPESIHQQVLKELDPNYATSSDNTQKPSISSVTSTWPPANIGPTPPPGAKMRCNVFIPIEIHTAAQKAGMTLDAYLEHLYRLYQKQQGQQGDSQA